MGNETDMRIEKFLSSSKCISIFFFIENVAEKKRVILKYSNRINDKHNSEQSIGKNKFCCSTVCRLTKPHDINRFE